MAFNYMTAQEAAQMIKNGDTIGTSGFTAPGSPKAISQAVAEIAEKEHAEGRPYKINLFTGASTSDKVDGCLSRANALNMRAPYQNVPHPRTPLNAHDVHYFDRHLSEMAQEMRYGFYGKLDYAIIEAADVTPEGEIVLGCGVGNVPTYAALADKIFIELNEKLPHSLLGMHDVYMPLDPPYRREIPIYSPSDRVGSPILKVDHRSRRGEQADRQQRRALPRQRVRERTPAQGVPAPAERRGQRGQRRALRPRREHTSAQLHDVHRGNPGRRARAPQERQVHLRVHMLHDLLRPD